MTDIKLIDFLGLIGSITTIVVAAIAGRHYLIRLIIGHTWKADSAGWQIISPLYANLQGGPKVKNLARIEDVLAHHEVVESLKTAKTEYVNLKFGEETEPSIKNSILICGPFANSQSKNLAKNFKLCYEIKTNKEKNFPFIYDHFSKNEIYSPSDRSKEKADIAIVGRITDPETKQKQVILWGLHGVGTFGAAAALNNSKFMWRIRREVGSADFLVLVKVTYSSIEAVDGVNFFHQIRIGSETLRK